MSDWKLKRQIVQVGAFLLVMVAVLSLYIAYLAVWEGQELAEERDRSWRRIPLICGGRQLRPIFAGEPSLMRMAVCWHRHKMMGLERIPWDR